MSCVYVYVCSMRLTIICIIYLRKQKRKLNEGSINAKMEYGCLLRAPAIQPARHIHNKRKNSEPYAMPIKTNGFRHAHWNMWVIDTLVVDMIFKTRGDQRLSMISFFFLAGGRENGAKGYELNTQKKKIFECCIDSIQFAKSTYWIHKRKFQIAKMNKVHLKLTSYVIIHQIAVDIFIASCNARMIFIYLLQLIGNDVCPKTICWNAVQNIFRNRNLFSAESCLCARFFFFSLLSQWQ